MKSNMDHKRKSGHSFQIDARTVRISAVTSDEVARIIEDSVGKAVRTIDVSIGTDLYLITIVESGDDVFRNPMGERDWPKSLPS